MRVGAGTGIVVGGVITRLRTGAIMTATTAMAALWTLVAGVGAFVVVCLSLGIARWWVLRPGNAVVARAKRGEITLWQAACEAQGARGFVCAGARVLHRRGLVHISRDGLVTATDTSPDQAPDPYSARILDAVRRRAALGRVRLRDLAHDLDHRDVPRVAPELDVIERRAKAVTTTATRVTTAIVWACTITWAVLVVPDWAYLYAVLAVGVFLTMCAIRGENSWSAGAALGTRASASGHIAPRCCRGI